MIRLLTLTAVLLVAADASGWGIAGHQIAGLIAEQRLTPKALAEVNDLLGEASDGGQAELSDAEVCGWADEIRRRRQDTAGFHFVNVPIDAAGYDPARDDPDGKHLVTAIARFEAVLSDRGKPKSERAEALKFLTHLIGDLHQPLHVCDRNDRGGNDTMVLPPNHTTAKNLHQLWDSIMLQKYIGNRPLWQYAEASILDEVTEWAAAEWSKGDVVEWVNEAHKLAREHAYRDVPPATQPVDIAPEYIDTRREVVELQLRRAGVRLAKVLNKALN